MSGAAGLVVMGAGGHAKVVVATLLDLGLTVSAVLDDDPGRQGGRLLGLTVAGPIAGSPTAGQPAILAVGDNADQIFQIGHIATGFDAHSATISPARLSVP